MSKKPSNEHRMVEYSTQDQFEAEEADRLRIQAARDALAADQEADGMPTISAERRAELKKQARQAIEDRLAARRKARRLMRGGRMP